MSRERIKRLGLSFLAVLIGLGLTPMLNANATTTPITRSRWPKPRVTYVIKGSRYYQNVYKAAIKSWNAKSRFKFVAGTKAHHQVTLSTSTGTRGAYYHLSGITYMTGYPNGYYTKARVLLLTRNLSKYHYSYSNRIHVAEHELGHVIGLKHSKAKNSVMNKDDRYYGISKADVAAVKLRYQLPVGEL